MAMMKSQNLINSISNTLSVVKRFLDSFCCFLSLDNIKYINYNIFMILDAAFYNDSFQKLLSLCVKALAALFFPLPVLYLTIIIGYKIFFFSISRPPTLEKGRFYFIRHI
jgi:hypothetical protein